ncbi:MAG TPA: outer membrane lipoprotein carrier protein LolA [Bryocella sp.]|nr:outer membrane lipoprotein carrier protein LolA [Bryocella sp.]
MRWMALLLPAIALGASAQSPSATALAKKVDTHYNHLHSLEARYTERYQGMGMDRTETGTLTLEKPGRMRWAYDMPAGKVFILDGTNAISYTPGDAEATRFPEKKLDDLRSPLRFLLGHTELQKELHGLSVTLVNLDGQTGYTLWGTPVGIEQRVRSLAVTVDAEGLIHTLRMEETDGAITTFTLSDMRENVKVPGDEFRFVPPEGVTIIDGAAPV